MKNNYVPEQGDIIKLDLDPVIGHEQGGYRPAIVITRKSYNILSNVILVCPVTSKFKGHAYEVQFGKDDVESSGSIAISGSILTNHVKSIDNKSREITYFGKVDEKVIWDVLAMIKTMID